MDANMFTRNVFTTITHYPSVDLGKRVIGIYKEEVQKVRNVTGLSAQWITYSIPATAVRNMKLRGGNALGIDVKGHLIRKLFDEKQYSLSCLTVIQSIFSPWAGLGRKMIRWHTLSQTRSFIGLKKRQKILAYCTLTYISTTPTRAKMSSQDTERKTSKG
jgi:hypothetical protein